MSLALALLAAIGLASAGEPDDALACVRTKVWDAYGQGWSVRTMSSAALGLGEQKAYALSLMPGRTYLVLGCATGTLSDLDLVLYDASGHVVVADTSKDAQPVLDLTGKTGAYTLVVYGRATSGTGPGGAAVAVLHK